MIETFDPSKQQSRHQKKLEKMLHRTYMNTFSSAVTAMKGLRTIFIESLKRTHFRFFLGKKRLKKTDLVGYETLINFIIEKNILSVKGDFVEIGTFLGGGALKLSQFLSKHNVTRILYVIDVFDLDFDKSMTSDGICMADFYNSCIKYFKGLSQREVFDSLTAGCENIKLISGDSKEIELPTDHVSFAFIDGNHAPDYVRNDFQLTWKKLSPGGCIAFHDYDGDLPGVTSTIDLLLEEDFNSIQEFSVNREKNIIFIIKK